ncbi:PaaI family thioesterase [Pleionea sediminis]|uniref:PaaI family thioesterase n=1 Tax=Pleionea sediminis TaxID=2569479 RepID=UPI001184F580|nr:PaaI family thioesterase [Pleionea sediminis]
MNLKELSGLEIIQAIIDGKIPHPSMSETIPMKMMAAERGIVTFEVKADERHTNPMGGVHGGFAATVLDSVTGCSVHTELAPGDGYATVDLNVKMLKAIPKDALLSVEGKVLHVSKSIGVSEGFIRDSEGVLYAHATATCMIRRG